MTYDVVVLGNGILGSMATYLLSEKYERVLNISVPHGFQNSFYSSHSDESRIVHFCDRDEYWNDMAMESDIFNKKLSIDAEHKFYKSVNIYQSPNAWDKLGIQVKGLMTLDNKIHRGAVINPLLYIDVITSKAKKNGAIFIEGIPSVAYNKKSSRFYVKSKTNDFICDKILDARGASACVEDNTIGKVVRKSLYFFEYNSGCDDFCFITPVIHQKFSECYGVYKYNKDTKVGQLKIGFTDIEPTYLESQLSIKEWFTRAGLKQGLHDDAIEFIKMTFGDIQDIAVKPCMFTLTSSGHPKIVKDHNLIRVAGCNGKAAKCAYSIIKSTLINEGILSGN